jgi:predicted N-acyltransferase
MMLRIVEDLGAIDALQWDDLRTKSPGDNPFLSYAFLRALQDSRCASPTTGWTPQFITLWQDNKLIGAMPLYLKSHSWGEFVFDWAWAEAYQRHGLSYYPKLVSSVPFTPVTGARLLAASDAVREQLVIAALQFAQDCGASSLHCLFPPEGQALAMQSQGMLLRKGVQFHGSI